jgi:hypothetical protein
MFRVCESAARPVYTRSDGYVAIRGRDQEIVDAHGGIGGGHVGNAINPISPYNPNGPYYLGMAKFSANRRFVVFPNDHRHTFP